MKATNIFQSLKSKGVCGTDGIPPKLPGVSAAKFSTKLREASAAGKLNPEFKAVVDADTEKKSSAATYNTMAKYGTESSMAKKLGPNDPPKKEVKAQSITYDPETGTTTRIFSDADVEKYNIKKEIVTKAKPKPESAAKKKSCGYKKRKQ